MPVNAAEFVPKTELTSSLIPDWLTNTFLEKQLQSHYRNDGIKITELDVKSALGKIQNFASKIFRVKVTFSVPPKDEKSAEKVSVECSTTLNTSPFKSDSKQTFFNEIF